MFCILLSGFFNINNDELFYIFYKPLGISQLFFFITVVSDTTR